MECSVSSCDGTRRPLEELKRIWAESNCDNKVARLNHCELMYLGGCTGNIWLQRKAQDET